jgi:hypothetical protein
MEGKISGGIEVDGIRVTSVEEAKGLEAQGFISPDGLKQVESQSQAPQPKKGFLQRAKEFITGSPTG